MQVGNPIDRIGHYIAGQIQRQEGEIAQAVNNLVTGEQTSAVVVANTKTADDAVAAAHAAFPAWSSTPSIRRARIMSQFLTLVREYKDDLARAITLEHGEEFTDAQSEDARGINIIEFACGIPQLLKGGYAEQVSTGMDNWTTRQALGVVACITPFNFPVMVPMWMFPIAIACGNPFILKSSPTVPSASLLYSALMKQAGFPDGVFNVVQGHKVAVDALIEPTDFKALSFVCSTPTENYIYETSARHVKRAQALDGAKNHIPVMPDADMDKAADALMGAAFGSAGERCMAISVALLVGDAPDKLMLGLGERGRALVVKTGWFWRQKWV